MRMTPEQIRNNLDNKVDYNSGGHSVATEDAPLEIAQQVRYIGAILLELTAQIAEMNQRQVKPNDGGRPIAWIGPNE